MKTENILYTDGHEVTVTDSTFRVRKHFYRLDEITRHSFSIIKPNKIPGLLVMAVGLASVTAAVFNLLPEGNFPIQLLSIALDMKSLFIIGGLVFLLIGFILIMALKEKYGVHIETAEGEKDVLVSERREYVSMVVEALNKAFINMLRQAGKDYPKVQPPMNMSVSPR